MYYDVAEKLLMQKAREAILKHLLGIPVSRSILIEELPQETVSARLSDYTLRIHHEDGEPCILLLEFKSRWEKHAGLQVLEYRVRYKKRYNLPILSYILLLTPSNAATDVYEDEEVRFSYRLVKLYEIDASRIMEENLTTLMPFVPLMKDGKRYILEAEDRIYQSEMNRIDKADMITCMAILSGLVSREIPHEIINRRRDLMIESVAYDILKDEGYRDGWEKGLEKGIKKGIEKGIEKGFERSIRKMLLKGFKPEDISQILDVDIDRVLRLADVSAPSVSE
uniref:Rpn family recombination-promoting nuclease/putative transposase n=1 Tax=Desulfatirhabdium butyrativorans TaxID=340467 RepID=A0A7C4RHZ7_9BACT